MHVRSDLIHGSDPTGGRVGAIIGVPLEAADR
jgi:hypothetical protein